MERIARLGHSGTPRHNLSPGLRLVVHGNHNIYFRVTSTETVIVRVLHSARDVRRLSVHEDAMRAKAAAGLIWSEANLDRYIADPEGLVPGTLMSVPPVRDQQERADLIAYLARPAAK